MQQILKNIFTSKNLVFLFVGLVLFDFIDPSFANAGDKEQEILQSLGEILSLVIKMLTFIATFIIAVGGELMSSDLIIGEKAEAGLKFIWVFVRNITNIGFILILIYLAMANLFAIGENGGNWTIKEKLPKLIIALIAINGSFLAFKVVIQAVDVGTIAILSISDTALKERETTTLKKLLTADVHNFTEGGDTKVPFNEIFNDMMGCGKDTDQTKCMHIDVDKISDDQKVTKNLLVAFGVHFMHLERLPGLNTDIKSLTEVIDNTLFATIMALAYVCALIAIFIVMIFRVAALWFFMAFSPLLVAAGIMGIGGSGSDVSAKIVTYLLIPIKVAAIFSLTFIMMSAIGSYTAQNMGGAESWFVMGNAMGGQSIFTILWQLMTVAIFWKGAFWALDGTHAETIVNGIKTGVEQVGGFALKTATIDRPMFKAPGMKNDASLTTMMKMPGMLEATRSNKLQKERIDMMQALGGDTEVSKAVQNVATALNDIGQKITTTTQMKTVASKISAEDLIRGEETINKFVNSISSKNVLTGSATTDLLRKELNVARTANAPDKVAQILAKATGEAPTSFNFKNAEVDKPKEHQKDLKISYAYNGDQIVNVNVDGDGIQEGKTDELIAQIKQNKDQYNDSELEDAMKILKKWNSTTYTDTYTIGDLKKEIGITQ